MAAKPKTVYISKFNLATDKETHYRVSLDEATRFLVDSSNEDREAFLDDLAESNDVIEEPLKILHEANEYGFKFDTAPEKTKDQSFMTQDRQLVGISLKSRALASAAVAIALFEMRKGPSDAWPVDKS